MFGPRGLRARICNAAAMRQLVGLDEGVPTKISKLAYTGKVIEGIGLTLPIIKNKIVKYRVQNPTTVDANSTLTLVERRMAPVQDLIMPLSYDVPPPNPPVGIMDKCVPPILVLSSAHRGGATN